MSEAMDRVGDWMQVLHERYPASRAESWDNVGLLVGAADEPVSRVLLALDVTGAVVDEAAEIPNTLVLAHHPLLFRPLGRLTPQTASGRVALKAARNAVAIAAAHTNLDCAQDGSGTSQPVADVLGLVDTRPLTRPTSTAPMAKLTTFVPEAHLEAVTTAITETGAGRQGDYDQCTFRVAGTGTFRPLDGADPFVGTVGERHEEPELRLESIVPRGRLREVVAALREAHPYEEVAFDLVDRIDAPAHGIGLVGTLPAPTPLRDVAERIRTDLPAPHLRFAGDPDRAIERVAICGGAGDGLIDTALRTDADVYVTGDLRHHVTLDALEMGMAMIDAGHHATEVAALPAWQAHLERDARRFGLTAPLVASAVDTCPWR